VESQNGNEETAPGEHRALTAIARLFESCEWSYDRLEPGTGLRTSLEGANGIYTCLALVRPNTDMLLVYIYSPTKVPDDKRQEAAEFFTRANYGIPIGNFELDFADGEVRYKTSVDCEGIPEFTEQLAKDLVFAGASTLDRYYPGLMSVIYGSATPAAAVGQVEGG
jgi:hypothetical protein